MDIVSKLSFFLNEEDASKLRLSQKEGSFSHALYQKYNGRKNDSDYPEVPELKKELEDLIKDTNVKMSSTKRMGYLADLRRMSSKKMLIGFIWNLILAGDGEKVLFKNKKYN